ncbi:T9SS type A sorting domain-containing protein [Emticicia sp. CRIBPO]|uniref:Ig-like domain-containing protein n=1 Tax=Emticicia sp. CRIBPO TaxID=2683258 RepID=UPI0014123F3A|nr:T9SS type A sorting domain-containing protein [Emticicia sp. CRIBPO]NBA89057.1 T9SS type A sorting domain-containing protein [Emticicia sp. CRIBPO]
MKKTLTLLFFLSFFIQAKAQDVIVWPKNNTIFQRNSSQQASFKVFFRLNTGATLIEYNYQKKKLLSDGSLTDDGSPSGWSGVSPTGNGMNNYNISLNLIAGYFEVKFRINSDNNRIITTNLGVGDVFVIAGQSNAGGYGNYDDVPKRNDMVFCMNPLGFSSDQVLHKKQHQNFSIVTLNSIGANINNSNNQSFAPNGKGKYYWHILGDKLTRDVNSGYYRKDVPVLFFNAAVEDSNIDNWHSAGKRTFDCDSTGIIYPSTADIYPAVTYYLKPLGFRAVLWHQGEADAVMGDRNPQHATPDYSTMKSFYQYRMEALISNIRGNFGNSLTWMVSKASRHDYSLGNCRKGVAPNNTSQAIIDAQTAVVNNSSVFSGPSTDDITLLDRGGDVHFRTTNMLNVVADRWFQKMDLSFMNASQSSLVLSENPISPLLTTNTVTVPVGNVNGYNDISHKLFKKSGNTFANTYISPSYSGGQASFNISGQSGEFYIQFQRIRAGNAYSDVSTANFYLGTGGCSVGAPTNVQATPPSVPSGTGSSLSASCTSGGVRWYNVSSGGSSLSSVSPWSTPSLTAPTTYYAACNNGTCESSRVQVTVNIDTQGSCGTAITSGSNYKIRLNATNQAVRFNSSNKLEQSTTDNNNIYRLDEVILNSGIYKVTNIATNQVMEVQNGSQSQGAYIVSSGSYNNESYKRFRFQLDGNSFRIIPMSVDGWNWGLNMETYTGSGEYGLIRQYGYGSPVGDYALFKVCPTSTDPPCSVNSPSVSPSSVTINAASGSGSFSGTCASGSTIRWYNVASGGTSLSSLSSWTTPVVSSSTTYYAACNNGTCESSRVSVQVIINSPSGTCSASTSITSGGLYHINVKDQSGFIGKESSGKYKQGVSAATFKIELAETVDDIKYYKITNNNENTGVQVMGGSDPLANGANMIQGTYNSQEYQKFAFVYNNAGFFKIVPKHTSTWSWGLQMETYTGSGEYGLIRQYGVDNPPAANQLFRVCYLSGGARLSAEEAVSLSESNEGLFTIYPNPVTTTLTLVFYAKKEAKADFLIYDMSGRMVKSVSKISGLGKQEIKIDVETLNDGKYLIKSVVDEKTFVKQFVKQN